MNKYLLALSQRIMLTISFLWGLPELQGLYCMECRSQKLHGDNTKTVFCTVKWYNGGPTTELFRHLKEAS